MPPDDFHVPAEVYDYFAGRAKVAGGAAEDWEAKFAAWSEAYPELRAQWDAAHGRSGSPDELEAELEALTADKTAPPASSAAGRCKTRPSTCLTW